MHEYNLSQWILFFFIYSFIGWVWESCYVSAKKRHWVNRGFMHGPFLPLYGSGALVILISTIGVRDQIPLIFLLGMAAATVLEYCTGAVMERMFRVRYWDYSNVKFNVNGYICPPASLCWGCFSVLLVRVVHIPLEEIVLDLPLIAAEGAGFLLTVAAAADFTQSFNEAMDLKRILIQLEESREQIHRMQERLKETAEEAKEEYLRRADEKREEYIRRVEEAREERVRRANEIREELTELLQTVEKELRGLSERTDRRWMGIAGHLRRNPGAVSGRFKETMEEIREMLDIR